MRIAGFTAMELLVAVTIFGILVLLAAPNIGATARVYRLRGAARHIYAELQNVRSAAVMENRKFRFSVIDASTYQIIRDANNDNVFDPATEVVATRNIEPMDVVLAALDPTQPHVVFRPKGSAGSGNTFMVSYPSGNPVHIDVAVGGRIQIN